MIEEPPCANHPHRIGQFHYKAGYSLCRECWDQRQDRLRWSPMDECGRRVEDDNGQRSDDSA